MQKCLKRKSTAEMYGTAFGMLLAVALPHCAQAQEQGSEAKERLPAIFLHTLASANNNELRFGKELGFTGGATLQITPVLGLTEEASMMHWRTALHTYTVLVGPRFRFGRNNISPYVALMGGIGHAGAASIPDPVADSYGIAMAAAAGVDYRLTDHLCWRVVQGNVTRIMAGRGFTTEKGSTGVVLRVY